MRFSRIGGLIGFTALFACNSEDFGVLAKLQVQMDSGGNNEGDVGNEKTVLADSINYDDEDGDFFFFPELKEKKKNVYPINVDSMTFSLPREKPTTTKFPQNLQRAGCNFDTKCLQTQDNVVESETSEKATTNPVETTNFPQNGGAHCVGGNDPTNEELAECLKAQQHHFAR